MGQPVEVPHFSPLKAADFGEYCVFMEHNRGSDTEAVSDLLTDIGVTKVCNEHQLPDDLLIALRRMIPNYIA